MSVQVRSRETTICGTQLINLIDTVSSSAVVLGQNGTNQLSGAGYIPLDSSAALKGAPSAPGPALFAPYCQKKQAAAWVTPPQITSSCSGKGLKDISKWSQAVTAAKEKKNRTVCARKDWWMDLNPWCHYRFFVLEMIHCNWMYCLDSLSMAWIIAVQVSQLILYS